MRRLRQLRYLTSVYSCHFVCSCSEIGNLCCDLLARAWRRHIIADAGASDIALPVLLQLEFACAYHRLTGKRVLFPQGFHCTGMPIKVRT